MTARQIAARMKKRANVIEKEFRKTSNGLGIAAVKFTKELMTSEIYAIPEGLTKKGQLSFARRFHAREAKRGLQGKAVQARKKEKAWVRTGHLRRSERFVLENAYTVKVINDAVYAKPRHDAGKPGHRKINPLRVSHWRDELIKTFASIQRDAYADAVHDLLEAKKI